MTINPYIVNQMKKILITACSKSCTYLNCEINELTVCTSGLIHLPQC